MAYKQPSSGPFKMMGSSPAKQKTEAASEAATQVQINRLKKIKQNIDASKMHKDTMTTSATEGLSEAVSQAQINKLKEAKEKKSPVKQMETANYDSARKWIKSAKKAIRNPIEHQTKVIRHIGKTLFPGYHREEILQDLSKEEKKKEKGKERGKHEIIQKKK
jgi:hypothetical protein